MPRQCLFCPDPANTKEHLWPEWILESLQAAQPIRHTIGKKPPFYVDNPEVKVRAACKKCNEGWMSDLEVLNRPLIGALMHDISAPIDTTQQANLAVWTIKTAMVLDGMNRQRPQFYSVNEHTFLRTDPFRLVLPFGSGDILVVLFMREERTFGSIKAKSLKWPAVA
jgi:hypothetical protein